MKTSKKLFFGKTLLIAFIATIITTVLLVYLTGLTTHRSILDNSLISLTILAVCFFLFLVLGLYNGLNVVDNYSHKLQMKWRKATQKLPDSSWASDAAASTEIPAVGDDIGSVILGIVLWIVFTIVLVFLLVALQAVIWITFLLIAVAIYWVLIRALKLVFSKSEVCQNDLSMSMAYAFGYTLLYVGWIYGVILATTLIAPK